MNLVSVFGCFTKTAKCPSSKVVFSSWVHKIDGPLIGSWPDIRIHCWSVIDSAERFAITMSRRAHVFDWLGLFRVHRNCRSTGMPFVCVACCGEPPFSDTILHHKLYCMLIDRRIHPHSCPLYLWILFTVSQCFIWLAHKDYWKFSGYFRNRQVVDFQ